MAGSVPGAKGGKDTHKLWKHVIPRSTHFAWLPQEIAETFCLPALQLDSRRPYGTLNQCVPAHDPRSKIVVEQIYFIGESRSASELEVFINMPIERLRIGCGLQCTLPHVPLVPSRRPLLFLQQWSYWNLPWVARHLIKFQHIFTVALAMVESHISSHGKGSTTSFSSWHWQFLVILLSGLHPYKKFCGPPSLQWSLKTSGAWMIAWMRSHFADRNFKAYYNHVIPLAIPTLQWKSRDRKSYQFYTDESCSKMVGHISQEYELTKKQTNKKGVFHSVFPF